MAHNLTLYVPADKQGIIKRAAKLLAFYEDKSLSAWVIEQAEKVINQYEQQEQNNE